MTESEDLLRRNYWHRVSDEVKATECKVTGKFAPFFVSVLEYR